MSAVFTAMCPSPEYRPSFQSFLSPSRGRWPQTNLLCRHYIRERQSFTSARVREYFISAAGLLLQLAEAGDRDGLDWQNGPPKMALFEQQFRRTRRNAVIILIAPD